MKKLILQACINLVMALAAYLLRPVTWLYGVLRWGLLPGTGAFTSYRAVKGGINPYLAWILPPVMHTLGALIVSMGYLPGFGAVLFTAFASVAGAAFGDTALKFMNKKKK